MSDKVREFVEIPQQFIQDGNQVCFLVTNSESSVSLALVSGSLYETVSKRLELSKE